MKIINPENMKRALGLLGNKFFLVTVAFVIWMVFFDRNDIFSQYQYRQQLNKLEQKRDFYQKGTLQVNTELNELNSDKSELEKFVREKYLMKRDNEDVYLVVKEKNNKDK